MISRHLTNAALALLGCCASLPPVALADEPSETTRPELSAMQRADEAPLIDGDAGDARFLLDIRGACGAEATSRLGVMIADTAVAQDYPADTVDARGFAISVPLAQLAGLQPETLCPRLLRRRGATDDAVRFAVPDAFTAFVSLHCTDTEDRVRTAYRAVALDALINCAASPPPEREAEAG
jgi:hypothetical protein